MSKEGILKELNLIAKRDGTLRPEAVVDFARNPKTALHHRFTWDNSKAAEQWRLQEARMIIRVSVTVISEALGECRAFVSLKSDRQADIGYRSIVSVLSDKDLKKEMLQNALEEMQAFKMKYKGLKELAEVFVAIDKVVVKKSISKGLRRQLRASAFLAV